MNVLAVSTDAQSLITQIRVAVPLRAAGFGNGPQQGPQQGLQLDSYPYVRLSDVAQADVLVAQRGCSARHLRLMQAMRARGGAVIYEIDDLLTEPAPHLVNQHALVRTAPWVRRCLAAAHVVTVSTPRLAEALSPYASVVQVIPNYAHTWPEAQAVPASLSSRPDGPATVLLAASDSLAHTHLYAVLGELLKQRGPALQIVAVGRAGDDAAAAGLEVQRHALMSRDRFLMLAQQLPNVVAVIPLDDSRFSACKSAIKWFDYAEAGIPTITSKLPPYADVIEHGRTGLLVDDQPDAWREALNHALYDTAWRQRVVQAAREHVRAHHHLGLTAAAWQLALDRAFSLRDAPGAARPWWSGWRDGVVFPVDSAIVGLRRANRRRLERRRMRKNG